MKAHLSSIVKQIWLMVPRKLFLLFLFVAEGQRPRNYLSCCCCYSCSWIFVWSMRYQLPPPCYPKIFPLSLSHSSLSPSSLSPSSLSLFPLSYHLLPTYLVQSLNINIKSPQTRVLVSVLFNFMKTTAYNTWAITSLHLLLLKGLHDRLV